MLRVLKQKLPIHSSFVIGIQDELPSISALGHMVRNINHYDTAKTSHLIRLAGNVPSGTCEEIDPTNTPGDPKCIRTLQSSFIRVLNDKLLKAISLEIAKLHFFTRSCPRVSFTYM